jgi:leucyl/phenylalanyl-tRNA--protein transferase
MRAAYLEMHRRGLAHSVEIWRRDQLVGGLYGVQLGACFFGESMFSRETDASKLALSALVRHCLAVGIALVDCQMETGHLASLGARPVARAGFQALLAEHCDPTIPPRWTNGGD